MSDPDTEELCRLIRELSGPVRSGLGRARQSTKADGSLVTDADLRLQSQIGDALRSRWPDIPLLGEEMAAQEQERLLASAPSGFWCLDPLDGTSNYIAGIPLFSISLALIRDGAVQLGVVCDPVRDECFSARRGAGARIDGRPLEPGAGPSDLSRCIALVDFKRLPAGVARRLAIDPPYRSQRSLGSVALEWCWLAAGRGHLYVHGSQQLWDYAAGRLILNEAGGVARTCDRIGGACSEAPALSPRVGIGAVSAELFDAWQAVLEGAL